MEKNHHKSTGQNKANLPNQEHSRVAILWVLLLNIGYLMMFIGLRNQLRMRPSVRLAIRDIENSDERIGNKDRKENFRKANLNTTLDSSFNLTSSLSLEEAISEAKKDSHN
jgi:hypothetical protein